MSLKFGLLGRTRLPLLAAAAMSLLFLLPSVTSAAPRPVTFAIFILDGEACIYGRALNNGHVNVTLRSESGNIDSVGRKLPADGDGYWSWCVFRGAIHPNDQVTAKVIETGEKRTVLVPNLTVHVNRVGDVVTGYGPANKTLSLHVWDYQQIVPEYDFSVDVTTNAQGRYSIDLSGSADLVGDAVAVLSWENSHHDYFQISGGAPFVSVGYRTSNFEGEADRGARVRVTLKDPGGATLAKGDAVGHESFQGSYYGRFLIDRNHEYEITGGETVRAPAVGSDTGWVVPHIDAAVNLSTDVVTGQCFPNMPAFVETFSLHGPESGYMDGVADGSGAVSIDLSSSVDIKARFVVRLTCLAPSGDRAFHEFVTRRP